ncbi:MAG: peptidoglycan-binding protein [Clostridia bacterium]|nr:peptidoglycan-binding protein [Clostridia bacterium]
MIRRTLCVLTVFVLALSVIAPAMAASGVNLFSGDYSTLSPQDVGERVRILQKALITLKYLTARNLGTYGPKTERAIKIFQQKNKLPITGIADKKTLKAVEKAVKKKKVYKPTEITGKTPDGKPIRLLHWFNDIRPKLNKGAHLLVYDPETKISWTLSVSSRGNHADCEPLTKKDTKQMLKAFGGVNTWWQKPVYVKLPSGIWTVAATHDMPHLNGLIKNNDFDGHLCVHFLRDMAEAEENDPNYGVSNQYTIREFWYSLSGEEVIDN